MELKTFTFTIKNKHTYIYRYIHTCMHAYIHTCIRTYVCAYVHACVRTYVRMYIHMVIQLCTYVRTHIHTCIHTLTLKCLWSMRHNNDYKTTLSIEYICLGDIIMLCKIRSWGASMEVNIYRPFYVINFFFLNLMLLFTQISIFVF